MSGAEVWVILYQQDPAPHDRWCVDRYWPHVEIYTSWGDALDRWGALRDLKIPASFESKRIFPSPVPATTEEER